MSLYIYCFILIGFVSAVSESDCPLTGSYKLVQVGGNKECQLIPGCYNLTSDNTCVKKACMFGYYWNGTACKPCSSNVMICEGYGNPVECFDGYVLSSDNTSCIHCNTIISSCVYCARSGNDVNCTLCQNHYALYNSSCYGCQDVAYNGFDPQATACFYDGVNISVTGCNSGYALLNDTNTTNHPYCGDCKDSSKTGHDGYASDCEQASIDGQLKVTDCVDGFCLWHDGGLDTDWKCEDTGNTKILECTFDSTAYNATKCAEGFDFCKPSGSPSTGCYNCRNTGNGGYYYATDCTFTSDCQNVVSVDLCEKEGNTTTRYNNVCYYCDNECLDCQYDVSNGDGSCKNCMTSKKWEVGYYSYDINFVGESCDMCGSYCNKCSDCNTCIECVSPSDLINICYKKTEDPFEPVDPVDPVLIKSGVGMIDFSLVFILFFYSFDLLHI